MLETLKRLFGPEYLVVSDPGPMGGLWVLYLFLGLLFAGGLVTAAWLLLGPRRRQCTGVERAWAWFELWVCLAGLGTIVGRFLRWPGWSARIWPYSLALAAVAGLLGYRFRNLRLPAWLSAQLRILSLSPLLGGEESGQRPGRRRALFVLGLAVHLGGTGLVLATRYGWPAWTAPLALLLLLAPQAPVIARRRAPSLMALSPLFAAYAVTLLWSVYVGLGITVTGWQGLAFPDPMTSLFYVDGVVLAAVAYSILCQISVTASFLSRPARLWRWAIALLMAATLLWAATVYFDKRTHGATASDPYAYAQMGVDLAEHGTFLHRFELFQQVMPLQIAWAPLQPVGYRIPRNDLGDSPSVWATGASVLLAAGYWLIGEVGLYVTTPFVALLSLAATWALVHEALRGQSRAVRLVTAALAVTLLATSPEHVDRLLVPMADAPAQLFTVLALLFALRGMRSLAEGRRGWLPFLLAGICFSWAYWVRHTQLVLALPVIVAALLGAQQGNRAGQGRWGLRILPPLGIFFAATLVAALPDIIYRWRVFGGLFATETTELPLMAVQHIGPVAWQMLRDSLVAGEWGYLFPLAVYGGYRLAREQPRPSLVLGTAFLAVLLANLTYHSLRLRDLISLFPLVDLAVAVGAVAVVRRVRSFVLLQPVRLGSIIAALAVAWVVLSLALSRWAMIDNLWKPGWASFGYMRAEQRAAFDRLAELTPPEAIIGASLNAGAVMLYTGRDAIRPYDSWTTSEWEVFLEAMEAAGRPVYLLDDGGLMAQFIGQEQSHTVLTPVDELAIPLFNTRDRETGWLYRLEWD